MSVLAAPEHPSTDVAERSTRHSSMAGFGELVRLALRRDRLRNGVWFAGVVGVVAIVTQSMSDLYATPEELQRYADLVRDNATMIVQAGPGYGLDDPTSGAIIMNELSLWVYIAVALMNLFVVVRHTRTEEATERSELVRAAPVGRSAGTAAALAVAAALTAAVGVGSALALTALGMDATGAFAFGLAMTGVGGVFASLGAVTAQVTENPRTALGLGGVVLAGAFVVRAIGDVTGNGMSWTSPLGWAQGIRAFADERWWVLVLPALTWVVLVRVAFALQAHRDHGSGIVPVGGGPPVAPASLSSAWGLALRLQRASVIAWSVGAGLLAYFYGLIAEQADSILESYPEMEEYLISSGDASITDLFLTQSIFTMSLIASGFAVSSTLRLRAEEAAQRADPVLATPISRLAWASGHLGVTAVGILAVQATLGAATGLGHTTMTGELMIVPELAVAGVAMAPGVAVIAALTLLVYGWFPKRALATWGLFAIVLAIGLFGELLSLPQPIRNLSPFEHLAIPPAEPVEILPIVALLSVTALLTATGLAGLRRRDLL